ncbi:MAG: protease HtpX [bacterium]
MFVYARRIFFFVATNLAVVLLLGVVVRVLGVDQWLWRAGYRFDYVGMLVYAGIFGMAGSLISLALSKTMARMAVGAKVIDAPQNQAEAWLVATVERLAKDAGIGMPQVAVFPSDQPNAFATGARRDHALVAVSTGLLRSMNEREIEAVLGHEISHVANGDMVTLALLQGVVNTFVIFLSRVIGMLVDSALSGRRDDDRGYYGGPGYFLSVMISQVFLGIIASMIVMWYSRRREFRADAGSAALRGKEPMIAALARLAQDRRPAAMPESLAAFGIRGGGRAILGRLLMSHPPIEDRIAALEALAA